MFIGWFDYAILFFILILSGGTGIYQSLIRSKQTSSRDYFVADGKMKVIYYLLEFFKKKERKMFLFY